MRGDPLSLDLKALFRDRDMFDSTDTWRAAGWKLVRASTHPLKLMVAKHKAAEGYLFKKYSNWVPLDEQLKKYQRRLECARMLRSFFQQRNFKHLLVPQKWLYELPKRFARKLPAYVVIVEELPVFDRESFESEDRHRDIDTDVLRELCAVFFEFQGLDFTAKNMPFTRKGQVAFIDTEYLKPQSGSKKKREKHYMQCVEKYLSGRRLAFAEDQWDALSRHL